MLLPIIPSIAVIIAINIALVNSQGCPVSWTRVLRQYSSFSFCAKRLPEPVTWQVGDSMCKDMISSPLGWNETLYIDGQGEIPSLYEFTEQEVWSSLTIGNGKLYHSGAPRSAVGLFPFAQPNAVAPYTDWDISEPEITRGNCISIEFNKTAKIVPCSEKKFMYCQRHILSFPSVDILSTYCPSEFIGNVQWNTCYRYVNNATTYEDAKSKCAAMGAMLVNVSSYILNQETTSDYVVFTAAEIYFYNKYIPVVDGSQDELLLQFWGDQEQQGCFIFSYSKNLGQTQVQQTDNCQEKLPFMCQTNGKVQTDKTMSIDIGVVEWSNDRVLHTQCNLSRTLTAGESIHFFINDRPVNEVSNFRGLVYMIEHSRIFPSVLLAGTHRCEVRGLHQRQIWSNEMTYKPSVSEALVFKGFVNTTGLIQKYDIYRFNLATKTDIVRPRDSVSVTYSLQDRWDGITSMLREEYFSSIRGTDALRGFYSSRIVNFSANGKTVNFDVFLELDPGQVYTPSKEQLSMEILRSLIIQEMSNSGGQRRRRAVTPVDFDPRTFVLSSTSICSGYLFIPQLEEFVEFTAVPIGSKAISKEICITDKRPLVVSDCSGGSLNPATITNIIINQKCLFTEQATSEVTEALRNLTEVPVTEDNVQQIIDDVTTLTNNSNILTSYDVINVADILVAVGNVTKLTKKTVQDTIDVIDQVTNVRQDRLRLAQETGSATNRILEVMDTISRSVVLNNTNLKVVTDNVVVEIYDLDTQASPVIGIQIEAGSQQVLTNASIQTVFTRTDIDIDTIDAAIILPEDLLKKDQNKTRVALNIYNNWNLFSVRPDVIKYRPNSRILAASIFIDGKPIYSLGEYRIQALFKPEMEDDMDVCGYWNFDINDASGGWATDGCVLNRTESGRYVCVCDHLTNFAVLVNMGGQETTIDSLAINIITWVGLIISIVGLGITILSFLLFKHLRKGRAQQTLLNLAVALLCFLVVFLVGIEQTHHFEGCITVAVLIHYFVLVSFMWMLMEGILQYLRFVKVLGTYIPHFILKTAIPAWGIPLIPVIVVLAYDHHLYSGGKKACWMSLNAFYFAFAIPVGLIMLANAIVFIMILKNLLGRPKVQSNQSDRKRAMMNFRAALSVFVLLGLTWIFGFFTIEEANVVFQYIFTILNVFQGFFIFLLFTAREKKVRQSWRKLCCKEKPRDKYAKTDTSTENTKNRNRVYQTSTDNSNNVQLTDTTDESNGSSI